jgi:hypothetical protein
MIREPTAASLRKVSIVAPALRVARAAVYIGAKIPDKSSCGGPCLSQSGKGRREFAGDEGVEDAKAGGKLDGGQTMLIVKPAEKMCRGKIAFLRVAFAAAGDKVAIGIVLQLGKRDDMVDATRTNGKPAAAVKTEAAFPQMDSAAQGWMFEEVQLLEVVGAIGA